MSGSGKVGGEGAGGGGVLRDPGITHLLLQVLRFFRVHVLKHARQRRLGQLWVDGETGGKMLTTAGQTLAGVHVQTNE